MNWTKTSAFSSLDPTVCTLQNINLIPRLKGNSAGMFRRPAVRYWCSIISKGTPFVARRGRVVKDTGSEQDLRGYHGRSPAAQGLPWGFINFEYTFNQPGKFIGVVTVGGTQEHVARFPISVGESGVVSHFMHYIMVIVPLAAIAGGAAIFFFLRGRRKPSVSTAS